METVKSFMLNGGILGVLRGYNYEKEGRPYGFEEMNEDLEQVKECCEKLVAILCSFPLSAVNCFV